MVKIAKSRELSMTSLSSSSLPGGSGLHLGLSTRFPSPIVRTSVVSVSRRTTIPFIEACNLRTLAGFEGSFLFASVGSASVANGSRGLGDLGFAQTEIILSWRIRQPVRRPPQAGPRTGAGHTSANHRGHRPLPFQRVGRNSAAYSAVLHRRVTARACPPCESKLVSARWIYRRGITNVKRVSSRVELTARVP